MNNKMRMMMETFEHEALWLVYRVGARMRRGWMVTSMGRELVMIEGRLVDRLDELEAQLDALGERNNREIARLNAILAG